MRRMIEQRLGAGESSKRETARDNPTWTKIQTGPRKGEWGARVESATAPAPGERIEMVRKDGTRSWMAVDEVVWSGRGVHIVSLKQEERGAARKRAPAAKREEPSRPSAVARPSAPQVPPGAPFVPVEIGKPEPCPDPNREWSTFQEAIFTEAQVGSGHVVVLARAGAGKSTTAEQAIRCISTDKTILFTSFAKKIVAEAAERFEVRPKRGVDVASLNSYGFRQVRRSFRGVAVDEDKAYKLSEKIVGDGSAPGDYGRAARAALLKLVGLMKATLSTTRAQVDALIDKYEIDAGGEIDFATPDSPQRYVFVDNALRLLDACKEDTQRIDLDDQVWFPIVHDLRCEGYDYVFCDEAQDMNAAQLELVYRALKKNGRVFAIGDDRQSIFAFRGADEEAIPHIIERLRAKTLKLTISYRCAREIAAVAKLLVPDFESGAKDRETGEWIKGVVEVKQYDVMLRDAQPGDFIVSRTNAPLIKICWKLLQAGKRATIAGRDLGKNLKTLIEQARKKGKAANVIELQAWLSKWASNEIDRLLAKKPPRETEAEAVADKVACIDALARGETEISAVVAKIDDLFSENTDETRIVCTSTHKAKGLERDRVWLLRGTYRPHKNTQEANMLYVGITRARQYLYEVELPPKDED